LKRDWDVREILMSPVVSVVLSVHNGAVELPAAIESILAQTFADFELIVINDASTDGTAAVLDGVRDPRLRVVKQREPALTVAVNRGIALARGRYIARHDHDDVSKPARFAKQVAFLDANPDFALVGTRADIWVGNEPTGRAHDHPCDCAALRFELLFQNPFVQSSVMIRKAAIDAVGGYTTDSTRERAEDYELFSRLARRYQVANIPERLTIYREVPGSRSRNGMNQERDAAVLISSENIAAALGELGPSQSDRDLASLLLFAYESVSSNVNLPAMCRMIEEAAARTAGQTDASDLAERTAMKIAALRHHYRRWRLQRRLGAVWPLADALWRYSGLRYLRRQARATISG
jgi:glycosyltransferase involved in cell wall biosynthesis